MNSRSERANRNDLAKTEMVRLLPSKPLNIKYSYDHAVMLGEEYDLIVLDLPYVVSLSTVDIFVNA
jgi:hypothetical protein